MRGSNANSRSNRQPARIDAILNFAALGVAGLAGVALLSVIGVAYGPAELGRFNLVFVAYLVSSQVATMALHHGVLHHLGIVATTDHDARRETLLGAILAVLVCASISTLLLRAIAPSALGLVGRPDLLEGITWGITAAAFFALNKVLLSALTALSRFKMFAIGTSLRGLLLLGGGAALVAAGRPGVELPVLLLLGEGMLTAVLLVSLRHEFGGSSTARGVFSKARCLLWFGLRGSAGGVLADLNTRIDIICLSFFVDDHAIGIYTLAAALAEATGQLPLVLRTIHAPRVVALLAAGDATELGALVARTRRRVWTTMPLVAATVAALHPTAARAIGAETGEGRTALVLLLIGVIVASGYAPFGLLLAQGGDAAAHSWLLLATVAVNIAGNFTLIHTLGINGAAVATTFSAMASVLLLRAFARSRLRLRV